MNNREAALPPTAATLHRPMGDPPPQAPTGVTVERLVAHGAGDLPPAGVDWGIAVAFSKLIGLPEEADVDS